jgi:HEPN domain-containing protein
MAGGGVREEAVDWWREANHNLRQARKNFELEEFSVAAFLSHQAAEKALKALYIVVKSRLPPRGHDLLKLGRAVEASAIIDELRILNPHYTVARYLTRRTQYQASFIAGRWPPDALRLLRGF